MADNPHIMCWPSGLWTLAKLTGAAFDPQPWTSSQADHVQRETVAWQSHTPGFVLCCIHTSTLSLLYFFISKMWRTSLSKLSLTLFWCISVRLLFLFSSQPAVTTKDGLVLCSFCHWKHASLWVKSERHDQTFNVLVTHCVARVWCQTRPHPG